MWSMKKKKKKECNKNPDKEKLDVFLAKFENYIEILEYGERQSLTEDETEFIQSLHNLARYNLERK